MKTFIYGLKEERGEIRYVGKSDNPKKRLKEHLTNKHNNINHKTKWIKYCKNNDIKIELIILEECDYEKWKEREIFWISQYTNLTNYDRGGRGGPPIIYQMSYTEVKIWVKTNIPNIKGREEWKRNIPNLPEFIPSSPASTYMYRGWLGWGDFLNTNKLSHREISSNYLSYEDCKKWCLDNKIKTMKEYKNQINSQKIPLNPDQAYRNKGWINWANFLNNESYHAVHYLKNFPAYDEAKLWCKENSIKTASQYHKQRPKNFPHSPHGTYKHTGWINWYEFLNKPYMEYIEAKQWCRDNNIKNYHSYEKLRKQLNANLPVYKNLIKYYTDKGWISENDFFDSIYTNHYLKFIGYPSYEEAKKWNLTENIITNKQYQKNRPENFTTRPHVIYKNTGWIDWYDFLNKPNKRN